MKRIITMHSEYDPVAFGEALRCSIDEEHRTFFSLSGYEGTRPILGEVGANSFRIQRRRYSRNDFAGHLYGSFIPEGTGTKIEAHFDMPRWARYLWRFWLGGAVVIGTIIFVQTLLGILTGPNQLNGDRWVGFVVPPSLVGYSVLFPMLTRRFGRKDRRFLLEFLQRVGATRVDDMEENAR